MAGAPQDGWLTRPGSGTSLDRAEVLTVALVTIASVVVGGWIAVWLLSDAGAAWLGAAAGLPVAMLPASIGTVILRWHRWRAASSDRTPHE